ncbi:MAG: hypothetical protein RLZZ156_323 [Deinococcota bacterium]|jgi:hypothetical protein
MKNLKTLLLGLLLTSSLMSLLTSSLVLAQSLPSGVEAQIGQQYQAGTRVNFPKHGLSFVIPTAFTGTTVLSAGNQTTVLSRAQDISVVVWAFSGLEPQDAAVWLAYPIEISDTLKFQLQAQPVVQNNLVYAYHTSPQLDSLTIIAFGQNNAIGFTIISTKSASQELSGIANTLLGNLAFAPSPTFATVQQLRQGLGGLYLLHYAFKAIGSSGFGGTESKRQWDLCSNGTYAYFGRVESSYTTNNPYAATSLSVFNTSGANEIGTWRVFAVGDAYTLLTISNQGVLDWHILSNLERANGKLPFLNGKELGAFGRSSICQ